MRHLWLVDVDDRTLQALELRKDDWVSSVRLKGETEVSIAPFEATASHLGDRWT